MKTEEYIDDDDINEGYEDAPPKLDRRMGGLDDKRPSRIAKKKRIRQYKSVLNIRGINPNIKRIFKSYCATRGYTMTQAIEALMREAAVNGRILKVRGPTGTV